MGLKPRVFADDALSGQYSIVYVASGMADVAVR